MGFFIYIQTSQGTRKVEAEFPTYDDAERYMTNMLKNSDVIIRDYEIVKNPNSKEPKFKLVSPWKTNQKWDAWNGKFEQ